LGYGIETVVAGVFQIALPAADERAAGGFLVDVGIHDAEVLGDIVAIHRRGVAVVVAVIGQMGLIDHVVRVNVCVAKVPAARMGGVGASAPASGKFGELRGLGIDRVVVAETGERPVLGTCLLYTSRCV